MARRPLSGAFEKVRRAKSHIKTLEEEIGGLKRFEAYDVVPDTDMQCVERIEIPRTQAQALGLTVQWRGPSPADPKNVFVPLIHAEVMGLYLKINRPLPVLVWGAIIGDCVNNLRSALDQLVWELSIYCQRSLQPTTLPKNPTPPRGSPWRKVCFPVAETPTAWHGHRTNSLRLIDQNLISKFDDEQPYKRGNRYQRHWLWLLDELWNRDKHRTVAISTMYGATRRVGLAVARDDLRTTPAILAHEFEVRQLSANAVGRFVDGMKLARILISRKDPRLPDLNFQLDVETTLVLEVHFKQSPPTYGAEVLNTLEGLTGNVERVLNSFVPDFK